MKYKILALALALVSFQAGADLRFYKHVPELNFKTDEEAAKDNAKDAFFVAMQGYTCYLPSEDSFCTVPLKWSNNLSDVVSIWRDGIKLATGYNGHLDATVRLGQSFDYYIRKGTSENGEVVDAANVKALFDPNAITGLLKSQNDGICEITYGKKTCIQPISWETNSPIATIWMRGKGEPVKVREVTIKSGGIEVEIGEFSNLYELRGGKNADGNLLASVSVEGKAVEYSGTLSLTDGSTCLVGSIKESCELPVKWTSDKKTSVWVDNIRQSEPSAGGTSLISIPYGTHKVALRPENVLGTSLDSENVEAEISDIKASITLMGEVCTIGISENTCTATAAISTNLPAAYLFKDDTYLTSGSSFNARLEHTESGTIYTLRESQERSSQIIASYLAKAPKQNYVGTLTVEGECVFPYKGAVCSLPARYEANVGSYVVDTKGNKYNDYNSYTGYYDKQRDIGVSIKNNGDNTTTETFMLKAYESGKDWVELATLDQHSVTGILKLNTGTMELADAPICNLASNRDSCSLGLLISSTASRVSIWRHDGVRVLAEAMSGDTEFFNVPVLEGENTFYLKEGNGDFEGSLAEVKASGVRVEYYVTRSPDMVDKCTELAWEAGCNVIIKLKSNLKNESYSAYYLSSSTSAYDRYNRIGTQNGGDANISYFMRPASGLDMKRKIVIASGSSNSIYDEKIKGSISSTYTKISELVVYDEFYVVAKPSGLTVKEFSDRSDARCKLYPGSTYCDVSAIYEFSFQTDSEQYRGIACLLNGSNLVAYKGFSGTTGELVDKISWSRHLYPNQDFRVVVKNATSEKDCKDVNFPELYSKQVDVNYEYTKFEDVKIVLDSPSYSCNLKYHGDAKCTVAMSSAFPANSDRILALGSGNGKPTVYVSRRDGAYISHPITQSADYLTQSGKLTTNHAIDIYEGERDIVVDLMLMVGDNPSNNDISLDSAVINHNYSPVKAKLYLQRNILSTSLYSILNGYYSTDHIYDESGGAEKLRNKLPGIFITDSKCLVHFESDYCKIQIAAQAISGSASIFLDGKYLGSIDQYNSSRCSIDKMPENCGYQWHTVDLPLGSHSIQLYDGVGEGSKNNPIVEERILTASRPEYTGSITLNPRKIRYYGGSEEFVIEASANRRVYLFRKDKPKALAENTMKSYVSNESLSYTDTLSKGSYTYLLGSHADKNDPSFELLDEKTLVVEEEVNSVTLQPEIGSEFYFNACYQAVYEQGCEIRFSYKGAASSTISDGKYYASMCLVSRTGSLEKTGNLYRFSSFKTALSRINEDSVSLFIYDGLDCPEDIGQTHVPLLGRIDNLSIKHDVVPSANITQRNGYTNYSLNDKGEWQCLLNYEGDSGCTFYLAATPAGQVVDNKSLYSIGAWVDGAWVSGSESGLYQTNIATDKITERKIQIVVCGTQMPSKEGCPLDTDKVLATALVNVGVKPYKYNIEFPIGDTCLVAPGQSACYINFEVNSTAPNISVIDDNQKLVGYHSSSTQTKVKQTVLIDLSNDGSHEYKIVTGRGATNTPVKTFTLKARPMTDDDFNLKDASGKIVDRNATLDNVAVIDPLGLDGSLTYRVSGGYFNYHSRVGKVRLYVDLVSPEQSTMSGDGVQYFTSPDYSLINQALSHASLKNFSVRTNWLNEVGNAGYVIHSLTVPYKMIGYGFAPYSVSPTNGTTGMTYASGSDRTCKDILCINVKSEVNIDGTVMKANEGCDYCGTIALRQVSFNNSADVQKQFRVALNSGFTQHRFFYRIVDTNTISDPSVTFKGQVRPLNMDGAWHALEFETMKGGEALDFSWVGNAAGKGAIEFFGRYERD